MANLQGARGRYFGIGMMRDDMSRRAQGGGCSVDWWERWRRNREYPALAKYKRIRWGEVAFVLWVLLWIVNWEWAVLAILVPVTTFQAVGAVIMAGLLVYGAFAFLRWVLTLPGWLGEASLALKEKRERSARESTEKMLEARDREWRGSQGLNKTKGGGG